ncbi:hypothetical protein Bbelb_221390 [Branchiostoma belcheri]|nr:hypothetical protein Bbelb_221390 [Branchiostoma belcheri]
MSAWRRILFCPDHHRTDESKLSTTDTSKSVRSVLVGRSPVGHEDPGPSNRLDTVHVLDTIFFGHQKICLEIIQTAKELTTRQSQKQKRAHIVVFCSADPQEKYDFTVTNAEAGKKARRRILFHLCAKKLTTIFNKRHYRTECTAPYVVLPIHQRTDDFTIDHTVPSFVLQICRRCGRFSTISKNRRRNKRPAPYFVPPILQRTEEFTILNRQRVEHAAACFVLPIRKRNNTSQSQICRRCSRFSRNFSTISKRNKPPDPYFVPPILQRTEEFTILTGRSPTDCRRRNERPAPYFVPPILQRTEEFTILNNRRFTFVIGLKLQLKAGPALPRTVPGCLLATSSIAWFRVTQSLLSHVGSWGQKHAGVIEQVNWEARNTQPMCAAHACYVRCPYSNCPLEQFSESCVARASPVLARTGGEFRRPHAEKESVGFRTQLKKAQKKASAGTTRQDPKKWATEDDRAASEEDDRREEESDGSSHLHALITCE